MLFRFYSIVSSQLTFLIALFAIKYGQFIDGNPKQQWIDYCLSDSKFCANCFGASDQCYTFLDDIELVDDVVSAINSMFGGRTIQVGRLISTGEPIVLKHVTNSDKLNLLIRHVCGNQEHCKITANNEDAQRIEYFVRNSERIDGIQKCKNGVTTNFVQTLDLFTAPAVFWTQFFVNPELVLLKALNNDRRFDHIVPTLYDSNGFVLIESFGGTSLYEFYSHTFRDRLHLAKNLLQAAREFSIGTNGLRIYLTDLTPDNIVVNAHTLRTIFVDLDNSLIVDSTVDAETSRSPPSDWHQIHRHEQIECNGCFAYVPEEICSHHLSDLNMFSVCQILLEDLSGNRSRGLLHSIPDAIDGKLLSLLEGCFFCNHSTINSNRFTFVEPLITLIDHLLVVLKQ